MIVDPSLKGEALMHLKIQEHPPTVKLVNLLRTSPPPTEDIARQWFTTLASRVVGECLPMINWLQWLMKEVSVHPHGAAGIVTILIRACKKCKWRDAASSTHTVLLQGRLKGAVPFEVVHFR